MNLDLIETLLDVAFVGLLVAVLVYAVRLNRNIGVLQDSKAELQTLMAQFVASTERAEQALQRIKDRSRDATMSIDEAITEAKSLKSELHEMIRRAEGVNETYEKPSKSKVKTRRASKAPGASKSSTAKKREYRSGYSDGPVDKSSSDMDTEIDKDLEDRLARLIDSVEAGEHDMLMDPQRDVKSESSLSASAEEEVPQNTEAKSEGIQGPGGDAGAGSKAKSKEELIRALRGMR